MMIYVVGLGPGSSQNITPQVSQILRECDAVIGYTTYIDLIRFLLEDKEIVETGIKKERERCIKAVDLALEGKKVVVVSSGDSGVYGMASLIHEVAEPFPELKIQVYPGITAAVSGAPLSNDFAVISLSDLLTPWTAIEKRLICAAKGGFAICLYNPSSKKRHNYLKKAVDIMSPYIPQETICGFVTNIDRAEEHYTILSFKELGKSQVDMFTTVFIGNEQTRLINGKMVTNRGYRIP